MTESELRGQFLTLTRQYAGQRRRMQMLEEVLHAESADTLFELGIQEQNAANNLLGLVEHGEPDGSALLSDQLTLWCAAARAQARAKARDELRQELLKKERLQYKLLREQIMAVWDQLRGRYTAVQRLAVNVNDLSRPPGEQSSCQAAPV